MKRQPRAALSAFAQAPLDWKRLGAELDAQGYAAIPALLDPGECETIAGWYPDDTIFRSHVVMARHGFGRGEYKYFADPLPPIISGLRRTIYPHLAAIANRWSEAAAEAMQYPTDHAEFLLRCHDAGQTKPTPLLLRYTAGDYNCLHQDIYGEYIFPLQIAILLSEPNEDFTGGEFVLTEQRPRMQSRVAVVPLRRGDAVLFPVRHRPVHGTKGVYRVTMRHGVSVVRSGLRHTLGLIFHDAT